MSNYRSHDNSHEPPTFLCGNGGVTRPIFISVVDIVGSTQLVRRLGDRAYASLIAQFRDAARFHTNRFEAFEFADTGDGFIHFYDRPDRALTGTLELFRSNDRLNVGRDHGLQLRGAIHRGCLVSSGSGYFGVALHDACEMGQNATDGALWVSAEARQAMGPASASLEGELVALPKSGWREVFPWVIDVRSRGLIGPGMSTSEPKSSVGVAL